MKPHPVLEHEGEEHPQPTGGGAPAPEMPKMVPQHAFLAVKREDGSLSITDMLTVGRGSILPSGAAWINGFPGWWARDLTDAVIDAELEQACAQPKPSAHDAILGPWEGKAVSWRIIQLSDLPDLETFRVYRNALTDDGVSITYDMAKAKEQHRTLVRKFRAFAFKKLDGEWMRATGQGDTKAAASIEEQRQIWRDVTEDPAIDASDSIDELKGLLDVQAQKLRQQ